MDEQMRILLIEDSPAEARLIQELLHEAEKNSRPQAVWLRFERVSQLSAGLARLQKSPFDLVMVDMTLPDIAGPQAVAELRHTYPLLPTIALASPALEDLALQALAEGAWDYLIKGQVDANILVRVIRNTLKRKELAETINTQSETLRLMQDRVADAVWRAGLDLKLVEVAPAITGLTGFAVEEILYQPLTHLLAPDSRRVLLQIQQTELIPEQMSSPGWGRSVEVQHLRKDGSTFWAELVLHPHLDLQGRAIGLVGLTRDISQRHAAEEKQRELALRDPLTGLFNRAYYEEELRRLEFSRFYPISILIAEISNLDSFYEERGLAVGDRLVQRAASVLRDSFRSEDMIARIGIGKFIAIMPRAPSTSAVKVMQRVINLLEKAVEKDPSLPLTLSLGIATAEQGHSLLETVKSADLQYFKQRQPHQGEKD